MIPLTNTTAPDYLNCPIRCRDEQFGLLTHWDRDRALLAVQVPGEPDERWLRVEQISDCGNGALIEQPPTILQTLDPKAWVEPYATCALCAAMLGWHATGTHQWTDHDGSGRWTGIREQNPDPANFSIFRPIHDLNDAWPMVERRPRIITGLALDRPAAKIASVICEAFIASNLADLAEPPANARDLLVLKLQRQLVFVTQPTALLAKGVPAYLNLPPALFDTPSSADPDDGEALPDWGQSANY